MVSWEERRGIIYSPYELTITAKDFNEFNQNKINEYEEIINAAINKQVEDNEIISTIIYDNECENIYIKGKTSSEFLERTCDATEDSPSERDYNSGEIKIDKDKLIKTFNELGLSCNDIDLYQYESEEYEEDYKSSDFYEYDDYERED